MILTGNVFPLPLQAQLEAGPWWSLLAPFEAMPTAGVYVLVPSGFVTDFATVPRLPFAWLLAGRIADRSAVMHDWLYFTRDLSRAEADRMFLKAMRAEGVGQLRRMTMYIAVRLFGWLIWRRMFGLVPGWMKEQAK